MHYFGAPWRCPGMHLTHWVRTPVGARCDVCEIPIGPQDCGVIVGDFAWFPFGSVDVLHRECYLLQKVGHRYGVCEHTRGRRSPQELRSDALELWQRVNSNE